MAVWWGTMPQTWWGTGPPRPHRSYATDEQFADLAELNPKANHTRGNFVAGNTATLLFVGVVHGNI